MTVDRRYMSRVAEGDSGRTVNLDQVLFTVSTVHVDASDPSHLCGFGPKLFFGYTLAPITSGDRAREWAFRALYVRAKRARIAFSFADQAYTATLGG